MGIFSKVNISNANIQYQDSHVSLHMSQFPFSILAFGPSLGRKDVSTIFRHFNFFFSEQLDEFMFLGPQAPLGTPFVRPLE